MAITAGNIPIAKAVATGSPAKQTYEDSGISVDGSGNATFAGTNTTTGFFSNSNITYPGNNISGIWSQAEFGTVVQAVSGSTSDFYLATPSGTSIMQVPTGTLNTVWAGNATFSGNIYAGGADAPATDAAGVFQASTADGTTDCIAAEDSAGVEVFAVDSDGNITAASVDTSSTTGGTGSAGSGNQYVTLKINGVNYKLLHDGTV